MAVVVVMVVVVVVLVVVVVVVVVVVIIIIVVTVPCVSNLARFFETRDNRNSSRRILTLMPLTIFFAD